MSENKDFIDESQKKHEVCLEDLNQEALCRTSYDANKICFRFWIHASQEESTNKKIIPVLKCGTR